MEVIESIGVEVQPPHGEEADRGGWRIGESSRRWKYGGQTESWRGSVDGLKRELQNLESNSEMKRGGGADIWLVDIC